MLRIFHVALREFITTVFTKGFLLGMLMPPVMIGLVLTLMPLLMNKAAPKVEGHIAVVDKSGVVAESIKDSFSADAVSKRRAERNKRLLKEAPIPDPLKAQAQQQADTSSAMMDQMAGKTTLSVRTLPIDADIEKEKQPILDASGREKDAQGTDPRLALIVIPPDAVVPGTGKPYADFNFFIAPRLDVEVQQDISSQVAAAVVDARIKAGGLDVSRVRAMTERPRPAAIAVSKSGETKSNEAARMLIPGAFMILLWISVFTCGQYLLTTTIEEKSSRVMEVLLSAVSPMQLMTGKILGQMAVGMLILGVYGGAGIAGLIVVSMFDLVDPLNFLYLAIYFAIAFFLIASMMAAIGSAVSDLREAQTLMAPIMIVLVIPMALWLPIMRNPNSMFAQICSFIPPLSPFVMVLRLNGPEKVPFWQVGLSIAVGLVAVWVFLWATAKIFRIGVLMYGKPPNLKTLISWIRMA